MEDQNKFVFNIVIKLFLYLKRNPKKVDSEESFYQDLKEDIFNHRYLSISSDILEAFFNYSNELCSLEAQSFLNEENILKLAQIKLGFEKITLEINLQNLLAFTYDEWRVLAGYCCTLKEWSNDLRFFSLSKEERFFIFREAPIWTMYQNQI